MPSKVFDIFTYIANEAGYEVRYSVPTATLTRREPGKFFKDYLEINKTRLSSNEFNFCGRFNLDVVQNNKTILRKWCEYNVLTGNISQGSDLREMDDQKSFVTGDAIITYGMYDAAKTSVAGLPRSNQLWVTVHPNRRIWMGELAPPNSPQAAKPFAKLVLPCAHDVGMNSMQNAESVLQKAGKPLLSWLHATSDAVKKVSTHCSDDFLLANAPNIIRGLAITQKDTLPDILAIGCRYFEFRPAHLLKALLPAAPILDLLYFHHGPIPGMSFEQYLHDCVAFLVANPTEIIVTQLRWDNVPKACARPSEQEITQYLSDALKSANGGLVVGDLSDLQKLSIAELREQRKRLIVFTNAHQYSSWSDKANATLTGESIVAAYENMTSEQQATKQLTLLQCQATATNMPDVVAYSVMTANVSNSCLLATKPVCDQKTLPWIRDHALDKLTAEQPLVIMNDFVDGATVETAIALSKQRLSRQ